MLLDWDLFAQSTRQPRRVLASDVAPQSTRRAIANRLSPLGQIVIPQPYFFKTCWKSTLRCSSRCR